MLQNCQIVLIDCFLILLLPNEILCNLLLIKVLFVFQPLLLSSSCFHVVFHINWKFHFTYFVLHFIFEIVDMTLSTLTHLLMLSSPQQIKALIWIPFIQVGIQIFKEMNHWRIETSMLNHLWLFEVHFQIQFYSGTLLYVQFHFSSTLIPQYLITFQLLLVSHRSYLNVCYI